MEISEGVIRLGLRPRRITPSSVFIILHKIRKPNSLIVNLCINVKGSYVNITMVMIMIMMTIDDDNDCRGRIHEYI